ncbi:hypothetical protein [Roseovarius sp. M141]|uniref:hypothetical protein n=1 Tax=Roseovarius sp. M141 TaxID=2583806 RepID=UPI0020CE1E70|nr:hypothetical protein [Roseovarius sp. M141]MCQ0090500.1 hypothetical protein [Roseovarius sp. M141]
MGGVVILIDEALAFIATMSSSGPDLNIYKVELWTHHHCKRVNATVSDANVRAAPATGRCAFVIALCGVANAGISGLIAGWLSARMTVARIQS